MNEEGLLDRVVVELPEGLDVLANVAVSKVSWLYT
jgi:hypothetical protein